MSHRNHVHLFQFFHNKELNNFFIAVAIFAFGEGLISIFVPIYLYQMGYSIYAIIFFYFLSSLSFVLLSYWGAKIVSTAGAKHAILISLPFFLLFYLGLRFIQWHWSLFFVLPVIYTFARIFNNYGHHLNFITHSERQKRGREISFFGAATSLMYMSAPFFGGLIIYKFGYPYLYLIASIVLCLVAIPLLLHRDRHEKIQFSWRDLVGDIFYKKKRPLFISFSAYAVESTIGGVIWPIFLILILTTTFKTGLIVMLTMLVSLLVYYFIGRLCDEYDRGKLLKIGTALYGLSWIARMFVGGAVSIFIVDTYKNIAEKVLHVPWSAKSYDLAERTDYFRFIVSREIIFCYSRLLVKPILILIFYLNFYPFLLSFALAAIFCLGYVSLNSGANQIKR
jgi:MFS family permease